MLKIVLVWYAQAYWWHPLTGPGDSRHFWLQWRRVNFFFKANTAVYAISTKKCFNFCSNGISSDLTHIWNIRSLILQQLPQKLLSRSTLRRWLFYVLRDLKSALYSGMTCVTVFALTIMTCILQLLCMYILEIVHRFFPLGVQETAFNAWNHFFSMPSVLVVMTCVKPVTCLLVKSLA